LAVRQLLVALDSTPLRRGFKSIEGFSWKPIWKLGAGSMDEYRRILAREREAFDCAVNTAHLDATEIHAELDKVYTTWGDVKALKYPFTWQWWKRRKMERFLIEQFSTFQEAIAHAACKALDVLARRWEEKEEQNRPSAADKLITFLSNSNEEKQAGRQANEGDLAATACERFVCMVYVCFLTVVLVRIRTLIMAIGGMYVLLLIGTGLYPLEPKATVQLTLVALLVFVTVVVALVFAQIHRDSTLSNITDTKPGELGADFWMRITGFLALPLLSLFASQFPSVNRFFYSWLQPAIEALNR
jgi:hypothetical protein